LVVGWRVVDIGSIWNGSHIDRHATARQRSSIDQSGSLGVVAIIDDAVIARSGTHSLNVDEIGRNIANLVEAKVVSGIGRGLGLGVVASKGRIADAVKGAWIAINATGSLGYVRAHSLGSGGHRSGIAIGN
jgi:hypothetical protein